jgi:hypothetical protein
MFDYGVLSVATDDEVEAYENRDNEKEIESRQSRIQELEQELKELRNK